ncbi:MAG: clan AA aspartic protease (TIGR02281 family) [Arenicella sp.]|jgi:clan AA aspartic protease (TIGR02281 family)
MNKWISLLLLLLSASLALNLYLLSNTPKQNLFDRSGDKNGNVQQNTPSGPQLNSTFSDQSADEIGQAPQATYSNNPIRNTQLNHPLSNRAELLEKANLWLEENNFLRLGTFLQGYLKQYPQDMEFLLLEAKLKVETTLLSDAIAHYYNLLRSPMTAAQQSEIELQIEQLSKNTIEQLKRNYSWDILAMFVEPLLQLEPSNRLYILSLSLAYAELYQEGLMENVLASLDFDDPDAQRIRNIILAQQVAPANDVVDDLDAGESTANLGRPIPLKQFGNQYVVEAKLSNNQVALLIDTGASVTAISRQYFDNLSNRYKINYLGSFNIATAGGSIMARMYQFRELTINHVTVQNLPVVILPMQGIENADGLLGMNFLREFDFKIDQRQSVMFIK